MILIPFVSLVAATILALYYRRRLIRAQAEIKSLIKENSDLDTQVFVLHTKIYGIHIDKFEVDTSWGPIRVMSSNGTIIKVFDTNDMEYSKLLAEELCDKLNEQY